MQKDLSSFMDQQCTASAYLFKVLTEIMQKEGMNTDEAFAKASVSKDLVQNVDNRFSMLSYYQFLGYALSHTSDPDFGYNMSLRLKEMTQARELLNYGLLSCKTVGDVIRTMSHYISQLVNDIKFEQVYHDPYLFIKVSTTCPNKILLRHISEAFMGDLLRTVSILAEENALPVKIFLRYRKPGDKTAFEKEFNVPVAYGQKDNIIVYTRMTERVRAGLKDENLASVFENKVVRHVRAGLDPRGLTIKIAEMMAGSIHEGREPTVEEIADKLSISVKNLQNSLKIEGGQFHKICNNVKKDLALSYVKNSSVPIHDIAGMLGFENLSVFRYKFRHWTGHDLSKFRQIH